jgi:hypothetical protein
MRLPYVATFLIAGLASACAVPAESEDGANDAITAGKADGSYSAAELAGALRAANELSFEELDDDAMLSARTASNIVAARPLATVEALDAVSFVGPITFGKLVDYAHGASWTDALPALTQLASGGTRVAVTGQHLAAIGSGSPDVSTYERSAAGWTKGPTLHVPGSVYGFFQSVSLAGDTLAVTANTAAPSTPDYRTLVFQFGATGWTQTQVLAGGGSAIALDGDVLAVGDGATLGPVTGRVQLYRRTGSTWQPLATLDGKPGFGQLLALRDNLLVVGTTGDGVYILDLDVGPATIAAMHHLATGSVQAIAAARDRIAVASSAIGTVDVYDAAGGTWTLSTQILAPAPLGNEYPLFGVSVALDGDHVLVGAPRTSTTLSPDPSGEGAVYVFDTAGALLERRLGANAKAFLGNSLSVRDGMYAVGGFSAVYTN